MKKTIAATVAVLALGAAIPLAATAGDERGGDKGHRAMGGHHGMMGGHHGGGHGGKIRMMEMIEAYDADGDGRVTQDEVDQWRANRLAEFDADGNGQLSLDEYEQLWLDAMRERMVDQFQSHDDDGDAQVTVEEFAQRTETLVMMRDRNDDGALSLEDLERRRGGRDGGRPAMPMQGGQPQGGDAAPAAGEGTVQQ